MSVNKNVTVPLGNAAGISRSGVGAAVGAAVSETGTNAPRVIVCAWWCQSIHAQLGARNLDEGSPLNGRQPELLGQDRRDLT
jgi:hypothetical protein